LLAGLKFRVIFEAVDYLPVLYITGPTYFKKELNAVINVELFSFIVL
jgi:hypothetical protein